MESTLTLAELLDRGVEFTSADAVALVQSLLAGPETDTSQRSQVPLSLETVAIDDSGAVRSLEGAASSVVEVAHILQALIRHAGDRVPGGIRYAVGRALLEVEAPPFETRAEFASALARFENDDRRERIARLYRRAIAASGGEHSAADVHSPVEDRRRRQPTAAELRRHLRESDLRLYEANQRAGTSTPPRPARLSGPIAACMLAGVALVAAGEMTHSRRPMPSATAIATTPAPLTATAAPDGTSPTASASVAPAAVSGASDGPRSTSVRSTRPSTSGHVPPRALRARNTRVRPTDVNTRERQRSRSVSGAASRRPSPPARSERGVIARIRFEWDNPFR
ncbi:MAG TPA: hypothetical protein VM032_08265 [Vicinamibacterales bacterium]|nr:hypothetical protein [Vicinamibacterales bacterium]